MLTNLMEPGGRLGYITVVLAFLMAAVGLLGIVLGVGGVGPVTTGERIGASATGAIAIIGTVGLGLQPTRHFLGAALAVLGAAAVAMMTAWAIAPVLISRRQSPLFSYERVVSPSAASLRSTVKRQRALSRGTESGQHEAPSLEERRGSRPRRIDRGRTTPS
jgi:hypothetical protein